MALFGVAPTVMRPTALALNVPVASFTSFRYLRAGLFRWRTVWPFLLGAVPLAFVGGAIQLLGAIVGTTFGIRFGVADDLEGAWLGAGDRRVEAHWRLLGGLNHQIATAGPGP
jgi:hypothetical protein